MVVSRDTFYRYQELANEGGVEALLIKVDALRILRIVLTPALKTPLKPMQLTILRTGNT